jgi:hypothetical protein
MMQGDMNDCYDPKSIIEPKTCYIQDIFGLLAAPSFIFRMGDLNKIEGSSIQGLERTGRENGPLLSSLDIINFKNF